MLIRYDCDDLGCGGGPHPWCMDCFSLTCAHTLDFRLHTLDVRAAIMTLPTALAETEHA